MMNTAEIRERRKRYNSVSGLVSETAPLNSGESSADDFNPFKSFPKHSSNVASRKSSIPALRSLSSSNYAQEINNLRSVTVVDGNIDEILDREIESPNNTGNLSAIGTGKSRSSRVQISDQVDIINGSSSSEANHNQNTIITSSSVYSSYRSDSAAEKSESNANCPDVNSTELASSFGVLGLPRWNNTNSLPNSSSSNQANPFAPELRNQNVARQQASVVFPNVSGQQVRSNHASPESIQSTTNTSKSRSSFPGLFSAFRSAETKSTRDTSVSGIENTHSLTNSSENINPQPEDSNIIGNENLNIQEIEDKGNENENNDNNCEEEEYHSEHGETYRDEDEDEDEKDNDEETNLQPSDGFMSKFETSPIKELQGPYKSLPSNVTTGQSGWADCRNLINEYGYISGANSSQKPKSHLSAFKPAIITGKTINGNELEETSLQKVESINGTETPLVSLEQLNNNANINVENTATDLNDYDYLTGTSRPYSVANTVVHHDLADSHNQSGATSINGIYSGTSIGLTSKLGVPNNNWRFGDVDALGRASSKDGKTLSSYFAGTDGLTDGLNGDGRIVNTKSSLPLAYSKPIATPKSSDSREEGRTSFLNFKNTPIDHKDYSTLVPGSKKGFDYRWLSLALGILLLLSIIGNSVLLNHNWILNRGSKDIVFNYFGSLPKDEKAELMSHLARFYNINITNPRAGVFEREIYSLPKSPKEIPESFTEEFINNSFINSTATDAIDEPKLKTVTNLRSKSVNNIAAQSLENNPKLHQIFYGLSYAPRGVVEPLCGCSEEEVLLDLIVLSQVTTRLRTYGTQCNQAEFVLKGIKSLNIDMKLSLGVWIGRDDYINWKQMNDMKRLLKEYPREYFDSIFIGNEVLFRQEKTTPEIIYYVKETKEYLFQLGYIDLPVGTSEIGSLLNEDLVKSCDFIGANVHPFFSGSKVEEAVEWTINYSRYQLEPIRDDSRKETELIISEVGWPSGGGTFIKARAGSEELQHFLDEWICKSQADEIPYFFFEAFDEPWKRIWHEDGKEWETQWGVFTSDRQLKKGIVLPKC